MLLNIKNYPSIFKILVLVLIFYNSKSFGAVSKFVNNINWGNDQQRQPSGVIFNPDGTKMYSTGRIQNKIFTYTLTSPFTISTATLTSETCNLDNGENDAVMFRFNPEGTAIFVLDTRTTETIDKYSLTTPYDVSTCSFVTGSAQTFGGGMEMRSFSFSNDGNKIFIFDQNGNSNKHSVKQFSLTSPFDISNPTQIHEYSGHNNDLNSIQDHAQGLEFSSDGSKMYLTGSADTQDVLEFTLSNPFDLSGNIIYEGKYSANSEITSLGAVTFSSDGSKMFLADFDNDEENRGVYQYSLTCGYGVITCINPTSNKDDVASVKTQADVSKKLISQTTNPILNRMEWLRRNRESKSLSNQNIKLQFSNEILASLSNLIVPIYFGEDKSFQSYLNSQGWSFWSEGTISIGKIGDTITSSAQTINTSAITLGADKKKKDGNSFGFAVRLGNDDISVGNLGSALDMNAISVTFYETKPKGDNYFIDGLLGISALNSTLVNNSGTSSADGKRKGGQIFSSVKLRETYNYSNFDFTPNLKLDLGYTSLSKYTETGLDGLNLKYAAHNIGTIITSFGSVIDKTIQIDNGVIKPNFQLDYNLDLSPTSRQKFEYNSNETNFVLENINNSTHNYRGSLGFDLETYNGLSLTSKYERNQNIGKGYNNIFLLAGSLSTRKSEAYIFKFDVNNNLSSEMNYKTFRNNFEYLIGSNIDFNSNTPNYELSLNVTNKF